MPGGVDSGELPGIFRQDLTPVVVAARVSGESTLELWGTHVTDLSPLAGLAKLKSLFLGGTSVSDEAVAAFQAERERRGQRNVKMER